MELLIDDENYSLPLCAIVAGLADLVTYVTRFEKPNIMVQNKIFSVKHYENLIKNAFHKILTVTLQRP